MLSIASGADRCQSIPSETGHGQSWPSKSLGCSGTGAGFEKFDARKEQY